MKFLDSCLRLFCRFKYPVSLPEDVAIALGLDMSNFIPFDLLIRTVSAPSLRPKTLKKYMPRNEAEKAFTKAVKKESYQDETRYSYFFNEGWVEFTLIFDQASRLRRLYIQHKDIDLDEGIEIPLECSPFYQITESLRN